jgi:four helix bundle protein
MKYERFEDLPVWQLAVELATAIYELTKDKFFNQPGDLRDQIRRSALSVSNNIAEGFERGTTAELLAFLYIARGSCGETRSMLLFTEQFTNAAHLKSEISNLKSKAESCSRQIRGWTESLQNSDIKGQRHLNEARIFIWRRKEQLPLRSNCNKPCGKHGHRIIPNSSNLKSQSSNLKFQMT